MKKLKSKTTSLCLSLIIFVFWLALMSWNVKGQYNKNYALIGDVGGTNIRFQLVSFKFNKKLPLQILKDSRLKVISYDKFEQSIQEFLKEIDNSHYPEIAVIALAGPISNNSITLTNVPKWGQLNGYNLANKFKISQFLLKNDFEMISYGLEIIQDSQLVFLNQNKLEKSQIQGVIGPGTGLGHSILLRNQHYFNNLIVLPSQAGHGDFPFIDEETSSYFNYLKQKLNINYIDLEKSFCGPSIPFMYQFYLEKENQQKINVDNLPTSQFIIEECIKNNPEKIFKNVLNLFLKLYASAIGNFILQHLPKGGIYLVGSLTNSIREKIQGQNILLHFQQRHPEMKKIIQKIPLVVCKQVDLGLKGSFVLAKKQFYRNKKIQQPSEQQL